MQLTAAVTLHFRSAASGDEGVEWCVQICRAEVPLSETRSPRPHSHALGSDAEAFATLHDTAAGACCLVIHPIKHNTWGDSDVILSTIHVVTAAMLEVHMLHVCMTSKSGKSIQIVIYRVANKK